MNKKKSNKYIDFEFYSLEDIAKYFRDFLDKKKYIILFAYNGTGKTRLSNKFKNIGKYPDEETGEKTGDTLYYNAFTEDLFYWDNDLENDERRILKMNSNSRFFYALKDLIDMNDKINYFLKRYADFNFKIDYYDYTIAFSKNRIDNIKISRGEENIFIWCFFLAIVQLVIDNNESYKWVKYIYIDDPISSLDDNNVIALASDLAKLLKEDQGEKNKTDLKIVISTHHILFYNILCNEIKTAERLFFQKEDSNIEKYILKNTGDTPFFHHVSMLKKLKKAADSGKLYTYHFNILRSILEKTASFHGYGNFSDCLRESDDENIIVHKRMINILNHGNYSVFEPMEMVEDNKKHFKIILNNFLKDYKFNIEE
ncbi:AAA family ATPase [uncultured Brachyspira sp.]|uniref:AAA family ATPase n=1 Tax=uncultured Brachyspira sp. TaxID=221953 RepID=UPI00261C228F|nr:AAA family ATPase [uncultured Brachyspira sp.]